VGTTWTEWNSGTGTLDTYVDSTLVQSVGANGVGTTGDLQFYGALKPNNSAGDDGDILVSKGTGTAPQWIVPTIQTPLVISMYDAEPARGAVTQWNGGLDPLTTGDTLGTGDDITVTNGTGKLVLVVNASTDAIGDITITGDSVNRDTGAVTVGDTDTITLAGNSTDNSTTDGNGNPVYEFVDAYITNKWFVGTVVLSTTEVALTDVDVYHISFEQFNDAPDIVLNTFDANIYATNANAEFDAYLFTLHKDAGNKCHIDNESALHLGTDGETPIASRHFRLRRGGIDEALDGTTDGFWVDAHYSTPAYVEDVTIKVWATQSIPLTLTEGAFDQSSSSSSSPGA
jgi:hypothetical protein